jgi:hypothetical protein
MALIAQGGPRRITALLRELAYLTRARPEPVVVQVVSPREEPPVIPPHYPPKRDRFVENAAMSREMYRL